MKQGSVLLPPPSNDPIHSHAGICKIYQSYSQKTVYKHLTNIPGQHDRNDPFDLLFPIKNTSIIPTIKVINYRLAASINSTQISSYTIESNTPATNSTFIKK